MSQVTSPWPDGYTGALSLTFDDGRPDQIQKAVPILNDLGFKGTFYICPNGELEDWRDDLPLGYITNGTPVITQTGEGQTDTTRRRGSYACKIAKVNSPNCYWGLAFSVPSKFIGQWVSLEVWVKNGAAGSPSITVYYDAGASATDIGSFSASEWCKVQVTAYFDPAYSSMGFVFHPGYAIADGDFYIDSLKIWAEHDPDTFTPGYMPIVMRDAADYGGGFATYTSPPGQEGRILVAEDTNAGTPGRRLYVYSGGAWRYVALS